MLLCIYFHSTVPPDQLQVSVSMGGDPIAGQSYILNCTVEFPDGLTTPVEVEWRNLNGRITSGEGITVDDPVTNGNSITLSLLFNPLRMAHGRLFICEATLMSSAPPYILVERGDVEIMIQPGAYKPSNCTQLLLICTLVSNTYIVSLQV